MIEDPATLSFSDVAVTVAQEVPPPTGSPTGSGVVDAAFDGASNQLVYGITWVGLTGNATAMHFHAPGAPGVGGAPPIVTVANFPAAASGTAGGSAILTGPQESDLLGGLVYFNIHTALNAPGEIRGQVTGGVTVPAELSIFGHD
jgi:hypothetical protein